MPEIITAIYENGVLRPLKPLPLQEQQTVRIQVLPEDYAYRGTMISTGTISWTTADLFLFP
jgi:predicted DNA-binding antitoxin AbrB/MazE fold protein